MGARADRLRPRRGLDQPPAARLRDRRRRAVLDAAHAVRGAGRVRHLRRPAGAGCRPAHRPRAARSPRRRPSDRSACCCCCRSSGAPAAADRTPRVTLEQAIARATRLDPNYVRALGQVDNAEWGRRAALAVFVLPSLTASIDATKYSTEFFNIGTGRNQARRSTPRSTARYELFSGRKFTDLGRTAAELESAQAERAPAAVPHRALQVEADYYARAPEPGAVARRAATGRAGRRKAWAIARARVVSGAAVQSDSLQLVLELTQARTEQLRRDAALEVSRLQLGRRIGEAGPVDAEPVDTAPAPELPDRGGRGGAAGGDAGTRSTGRPGPTSARRPQFLAGRARASTCRGSPSSGTTSLRRQLLPQRAATCRLHLAQRVAADLGQRPARDRDLAGAGQPRRVARHPRGPRARGAAAT